MPEAGGVLRPIPAIPECTGRPGFPHRPVRRMMIGLMKRIAHAIGGVGGSPLSSRRAGSCVKFKGNPSEDRSGRVGCRLVERTPPEAVIAEVGQ